MGTALIILIVIAAFFPLVMRWLQRFMQRRAEDILRRAVGMPPRDKNRRNSRSKSTYSRKRQSHSSSDEPIIPREYAEDVEFTETKDFSSGAKLHDGTDIRKETEVNQEKQISDVEWEEIRK